MWELLLKVSSKPHAEFSNGNGDRSSLQETTQSGKREAGNYLLCSYDSVLRVWNSKVKQFEKGASEIDNE